MSARVFYVIGGILAIIVIVVQCISLCTINPMKVSARPWNTILYFLTALFQGLTLLILDSAACDSSVLQGLGDINGIGDIQFEETCRISTGARLIIAAVSFWAAAGCSSYVSNSAAKKEMEEVASTGLTEPLTA